MIGIFINLWNRLVGAGGAAVSYLLDEYSGAAAAYSLRKLTSTYGGSAVRVRRASDNTEQDIGFVGQDLDETALMNFVGYQNLLQRSEEFDNAAWGKSGVVITPNSTTDPFGSNNAETYNGGVGYYLSQSISTTTAGSDYTFSVYVKKLVDSAITLELQYHLSGSTNFTTTFNFDTGAIVGGSALPLSNGWWRLSVSGVINPSRNQIRILSAQSFYIYGAQINVGTTAQPYQVTTSAARSGDGFVTKWYTQDGNGENLFQQSQTFENAYWNKTATGTAVSSNSILAPDGTLTADAMSEIAVTGDHYVGLVSGLTLTNAPYNFSCYYKANQRTWATMSMFNGTNSLFAYFDLQNGVLGNVDAGATASIQSVGNGWYRCSVTRTMSTAINNFVGIGIALSNGVNSYLGVVGSGVYIWGAQLSQGSWLQPYQVTTTTAILRRDASQSTAANQPRIVGGGVIERENGKAGVRFLGTSGMELKTSYNTPVGAASFFSAARQYVAGGGIGGIIAADSGGGGIVYYSLSSPNGFVLDGSGVNLANSASLAYNALSHMVLSGLYTGTTTTGTYLYSDGLLINNFAGTGVSRTSSLLSIGGRTGGSQPTRVFNGIIQEGLYYESNQLSNVLSIDRNLGGYYQTHWTGASSGLLDQFGGAAAAYSLRNLSSSYRGPLIRVRRSSDNAETDIGGTYNGDLDVASLVSFTGGQNIVTNSEDFTNGSWSKTNVSVTANATIAPDGALTADKLNETAVNGEHIVDSFFSIPAVSTYTFSFYIKAAERSKVRLVLYLGTSPNDYYESYFDLSNGTVYRNGTAAAGLFISSSIQSVGNGWFRCSVTGNTNKTGTHAIRLSLLNDLFQVVYLGTAGSGVYVWGAQLNTGILQPYIPTTTTAVNGANAFVTKWYTQDNNYQNLLLQSQTFENAAWSKPTFNITTNADIAPDGTNTAELFQETAYTVGNSNVTQTIFQTITGTYTQSIYIKPLNNARYFGFDFRSSAGVRTTFDVVNKTFLAPFYDGSASGASFSYLEVGGYFRISITVTFGASVTNPSFGVGVIATNTYMYFANQNSDNRSFYLWGAQLNEGSVAQPYTATTTTVSQRRDAIQATAANQPRIVNAGGVESEGNKPALFWTDGSAMRLTASFPAIPSPQSFFVVNRIGATSGIQVATLFDSYDNVENVYLFKGSPLTPSNVFAYGAGTALNGTSNQVPVQNITNIIHDTVTNIYDNNLLTISGSAGTNSLSGLSIGNLRGNPNPIDVGYDWFGDIQELLVYPSNLATRLAVNSNINSYYRIYWQGNGTALLDNYSGASAAYSLRNLSSAYTGPLIRVRRSNDNVERDIYGTFGGDLDIASLVAFVGANSGFVTTWYDQSGNARNAVQGTAANQPRIVNAGVVETENGKPTIFFDGTNDNFSITNGLTILQNVGYANLFSVVTNTPAVSPAKTMIFFSDPSGSTRFHVFISGTVYETQARRLDSSGGGPLASVTGSTAINAQALLYSAIQYQTSDAFQYFNGTINGSNTSFLTDGNTSNTASSLATLGGVGGSITFNGEMQEVILYTTNQLPSRIPIESNINNYYKIY